MLLECIGFSDLLVPQRITCCSQGAADARHSSAVPVLLTARLVDLSALRIGGRAHNRLPTANALEQTIDVVWQRVASPGDVLVGTNQRVARLVEIADDRLVRLDHRYRNASDLSRFAHSADIGSIAITCDHQ